MPFLFYVIGPAVVAFAAGLLLGLSKKEAVVGLGSVAVAATYGVLLVLLGHKPTSLFSWGGALFISLILGIFVVSFLSSRLTGRPPAGTI